MKDKKHIFLSLIILFFPIFIVCFALSEFNSSPYVEIKEDMIVMKAPLCSEERMMYEDIIEVKYIEKLDYGKKNKGILEEDIVAGWFENDEFDSYYLISHTECDRYIVIKSHNATFVFNFNNEKETLTAYTNLKKHK